MGKYDFIWKLIDGVEPKNKIFKTEADVRAFREEIEDATSDDFKRFDEARRQSWVKAQTMIVD